MDFDNFVVEIQNTAADKWITEKELELADTMDSKIGKTDVVIGDLVAATNDSYVIPNDPGGAAGYYLGRLITELLGNTNPKTHAEMNQEVK
jgi:hypothetical protein